MFGFFFFVVVEGLRGDGFGEEDGEVGPGTAALPGASIPSLCGLHPIPPAAPRAGRGAGKEGRALLVFPGTREGSELDWGGMFQARGGSVGGWDRFGALMIQGGKSSLKLLLGKGMLGWFGSD